MRVFWLVVVSFFSLVFAVFAAGTTYSLLAPGYVFADHELLGEAIFLTGSLALAGFGGYRLRALERRVRDFSAWLPPRTDGDHPEPTARVRRAARRAVGGVVAVAALLAGGVGCLVLAASAAEDLLATGVREPGVVVHVLDPVKGASHIRVRHGARTDEIVWRADRDYRVGDEVTVVSDPADPAHVRTTDEANENQVLVNFGMGTVLAVLFGLPFVLASALGWWRRLRAVARTGWRRAGVSVAPEFAHGVTRGRETVLHAGFSDGTAVALRRSLSTSGLKAMTGWENRQAWIGGWGKSMVVVFADGPHKRGPYAVPAYAIAPRISRSRR
jgi:hypothetical protein